MEHQNPISPALHPIPSECPICDRPQVVEGKIVSDDSPYGATEHGIEDLRLDVPRDDGTGEPRWTVAHVGCKYWFRDNVVNYLVHLGRVGGKEYEQYDRVHEAIRDAIDMDILVAHLGPEFVRELGDFPGGI